MSYITSKSIAKYLHYATGECRSILRHEVGLSVGRRRFLFNDYWYPLYLVAFESPSLLGHFLPERYEIGINKIFLYEQSADRLRNTLRHELAHYLAYIEFGEASLGHGTHFRTICQRHQWGPEVSTAQERKSDNSQTIESPDHFKILNKIKKLLALGHDHDGHEAQLALAKAQELMKQHQINANFDNGDDEVYYVRSVLKGNRITGKHRAISNILSGFFVHPIFNSARGEFRLEVTGTKEDTETAAYLASFLDAELEFLWKQARKELGRGGASSKNSFMEGVARGIASKSPPQQSSRALIRKEKALIEAAERHYSGLRSSSRSAYRRDDHGARGLGQKKGRELQWRRGINSVFGKKLLT